MGSMLVFVLFATLTGFTYATTNSNSNPLLDAILQTQGTSVNQLLNSIVSAKDLGSLLDNINTQFNTELIKKENDVVKIDALSLKKVISNAVLQLLIQSDPQPFAQNPFLVSIVSGFIDQQLSTLLDQLERSANEKAISADAVEAALTPRGKRSLQPRNLDIQQILNDLIATIFAQLDINQIILQVLEEVKNSLPQSILPTNSDDWIQNIIAAAVNQALTTISSVITQLEESIINGTISLS